MSVVIPMRGIIISFLGNKKESRNAFTRSPFFSAFSAEILQIKGFEPVYKPSSVVYGHLSRLAVADKLKRYSRCSVGRTALLTETQSCSEWGLHGILCYHNIGELLPRLSILTVNGQLKNQHSKEYPKPFAAVYFCCTVPEVTLA